MKWQDFPLKYSTSASFEEDVLGASDATGKIKRIEQLLSSGKSLLERTEAQKIALLALASGESVFLLGPPGTAKTMLAHWATSLLSGAHSFSFLLNQYTQPDELFGPVSLEHLGTGERVILTEGYLPESEVVFLDEVFKAGPAILNTLLTLINEHTFRNGRKIVKVPLKLLFGASNELPDEDSGLDAFYDRFLLRLEVRAVQKRESFAALISNSFSSPEPPDQPLTFEELDSWREEASKIQISESICSYLFSLRLLLEEREIFVSDRRWAKSGNLLKTSAFLNGRQSVGFSDLFVLGYVLWNRPEQKTVIAECARIAVTSKVVCDNFQFTTRIKKEIDSLATKECLDDATFQKISKDVDSLLEYLKKLSAELDGAKSGAPQFWKNVFSTLSTPFDRALMEEGVEKLLGLVADSESRLESLRFSKRPKIKAALDASAPSIILRAADEAISAATKNTKPTQEINPLLTAEDASAIAALLAPPPPKHSRMASFGSAIRGLFSSSEKEVAPKPPAPKIPTPAPKTPAPVAKEPSAPAPQNAIQTAKPKIDLSPLPKIEPKVEEVQTQTVEQNQNWKELLSQIDTFEDFVKFSGFMFKGDASDSRYRWNENRNNGEKWWNVGSRFNRFLDDRAAISEIEAECAKRGAGLGGKFHWVYAVCYIFEKNDGHFDERTKAELAWLSGNAWKTLEIALTEALS